MPMQLKTDEDEIISGINITPMVDVAFVVLIIFIVTASFVLKENIPLNLPEAQTGEAAFQGTLSLAITSNSEIYLDGRRIDLDDLPDRIEALRVQATNSGGKLQAFIAADTQAQYGVFASVVDRLRLSGVTEIALDTQPMNSTQKAVE